MESEPAAGAWFLSGWSCCEVGDAEATSGVHIPGGDGQCFPVLGAECKEVHVAVEVVGIRHDE
ncbi:hypothetical protein D3C73_1564180 [compost metagenome]